MICHTSVAMENLRHVISRPSVTILSAKIYQNLLYSSVFDSHTLTHFTALFSIKNIKNMNTQLTEHAISLKAVFIIYYIDKYNHIELDDVLHV